MYLFIYLFPLSATFLFLIYSDGGWIYKIFASVVILAVCFFISERLFSYCEKKEIHKIIMKYNIKHEELVQILIELQLCGFSQEEALNIMKFPRPFEFFIKAKIGNSGFLEDRDVEILAEMFRTNTYRNRNIEE